MARAHAFPDYPGVSTKIDRNGVTRYRFRATGAKDTTLPGELGSPEFVKAYQDCLAAIELRSARPSTVLEMPNSRAPGTVGHVGKKTFRHAWVLLQDSTDWADLKGSIDGNGRSTQDYNRGHIEHFLQDRVDPEFHLTWGDAPMADTDADHLQDYYDGIYRTHKTKAHHRLVAIRKLYKVAVRQKWIRREEDRTKFLETKPKPKSKANKPWKQEYIDRFRAKYPLGTNARTAFELAYGLGGRKADLSKLGPHNLEDGKHTMADGSVRTFQAIRWTAGKHRKHAEPVELFHVIDDTLAEALAAIDWKKGQTTFLWTQQGKPFTVAGLGTRMGEWCQHEDVDVPAGYRLHAIRSTFAVEAARKQVPLPVIQKGMGHENPVQTLHYMRQMEVELAAMELVEAKNSTTRRSTITTTPKLRVVA